MRYPLGQKLYFSISEVAQITDLQPYILRTWEKEFSCLRPRRLRGKNRAYRQRDINLILLIKRLLYEERFTVQGVRQKLKNDAELVKQAVESEGAGPEEEGVGQDGEDLGDVPTVPASETPRTDNPAKSEPLPDPPIPSLPTAPAVADPAVLAAVRDELRQILRLLA